jgi:hypothetical protein
MSRDALRRWRNALPVKRPETRRDDQDSGIAGIVIAATHDACAFNR